MERKEGRKKLRKEGREGCEGGRKVMKEGRKEKRKEGR